MSTAIKTWLAGGLLGLLCLIASPQAASAAPDPGLIEVGPGIYIAAASDLPPAESEETPTPSLAEPGRPRLMSALPAEPYVVGGRKTTIRKWPWQVSLQYPLIAPDNPRKAHNCGGSLVAPGVVVSAAHCFNFGGTIFRPPGEFEVISGRTKLRSDRGQVHQLADYYYFTDEDGNPLWNRDTITWDVVFAVLATDAKQETIRIAGKGEESVWTPGTRAFATGWGVTRLSEDPDEIVPISNVLRLARVQMISDSSCEAIYGAVFVDTQMVCAGERAGGVDVCSGDSGGPLVVRVRGRHRLIGSTSFADGCGLPHIPGVYARLATDPIRGALANGIKAVTGDHVLGHGARPANGFSVRQTGRSDTHAQLVVGVPSRGTIDLRGQQVRNRTRYPEDARHVRIRVEPTGKLKRRLRRGDGRVRTTVRVRFRPFNGDSRVKQLTVRFGGSR